jgi:hypothetical protein
MYHWRSGRDQAARDQYMHDICSIVWEILRLRRCKMIIINSAFRSALQNLLKQLLRQPGRYEYYEVEVIRPH